MEEPQVYQMPAQLGGDWAFAYKGIISDGYATKEEAEAAAKLASLTTSLARTCMN